MASRNIEAAIQAGMILLSDTRDRVAAGEEGSPTPTTAGRTAGMKPVMAAASEVAAHLHRQSLIKRDDAPALTATPSATLQTADMSAIISAAAEAASIAV